MFPLCILDSMVQVQGKEKKLEEVWGLKNVHIAFTFLIVIILKRMEGFC